ncbi:MAG: cation transporter [Flavobacteriaceae bacterium]|nr:cation transporter [Flavobacteriaceae bacterium]
MKVFNSLLSLIFILTITSCKSDTKSTSENTQQIASVKKDIQNIEVNIDGMTCEIGCAKLIESKISKLEGVAVSKVNFEEKIGNFTFDANKISPKEIAKNINGIAGGDLYKVTNIKTVD